MWLAIILRFLKPCAQVLTPPTIDCLSSVINSDCRFSKDWEEGIEKTRLLPRWQRGPWRVWENVHLGPEETSKRLLSYDWDKSPSPLRHLTTLAAWPLSIADGKSDLTIGGRRCLTERQQSKRERMTNGCSCWGAKWKLTRQHESTSRGTKERQLEKHMSRSLRSKDD